MPGQLLLFDFQDRTCGLPVESVREVLRAVALSPPAFADDRLEGTLNLRGEIVPVFSLAAYFRLAQVPMDLSDRLIVLEHDDAKAAVRADGQVRLVHAPQTQRPPGSDELVVGSITVDGQVVHLLDHGLLVSLAAIGRRGELVRQEAAL